MKDDEKKYFDSVIKKIRKLETSGIIRINYLDFKSKLDFNSYPEDFQYFISTIGPCEISHLGYLVLNVFLSSSSESEGIEWLLDWSGNNDLIRDTSKLFFAYNTDSAFFAYDFSGESSPIREFFCHNRKFSSIFQVLEESIEYLIQTHE